MFLLDTIISICVSRSHVFLSKKTNKPNRSCLILKGFAVVYMRFADSYRTEAGEGPIEVLQRLLEDAREMVSA